MSKLEEQLIRHEGEMLKPYKDSVGVLTIGIGHNLEEGISQAVSRMMFREDLAEATEELIRAHPVVMGLNQARRDVLINMAFNMGLSRLAGFRRMWAAIGNGDFDRASDEMLDSKWAGQVGNRAIELSEQMRTGQYN